MIKQSNLFVSLENLQKKKKSPESQPALSYVQCHLYVTHFVYLHVFLHLSDPKSHKKVM